MEDLLQLLKADCIFERAIFMDLQHSWKLPGVGRFVEASAHQLYGKWTFE
jgi:hypothetical protein